MLPTATALLVAALALAGVIVAGSGAVAADGTAEFRSGAVTVSEDGSAELVVETDGVDSFEVVVGSEESVGYEIRATVTPSGDGATTLVFDPSETGGDGAPLTAAGDAEVDIERETSLDDAIAPGGYDTELIVDGDPTDVTTFVVEDAAGDGAASGGNDGNGESTEPATVTEADVEAADVVVEPAETDVSVPVPVDDGETVNVRIRSAGNASEGFLVTEEASVEDGAANVTVDLSRTSHGDRATLTVGGNEALDESNSRDVLVVNESIGVEESGGALGVEAPGFGVVAGGLAVLVVALAARRSE
jgi:hypothetical protein